MTRAEAVKYLKAMKDGCNDTCHKVRYVTHEEALEMAIQALSQEPCRVKNELKVELGELKPCDDSISREAVCDALLDYWHDIQFVDSSGYDVYEDCKAVIDELPSVTQKSVLNKIRTEIEQTAKVYHEAIDYGRECGLQIALEIIDKYTKGENK